jgi:hypothetical protein
MRVALITGAEMAKPDPESHLLIHELGVLDIPSELISWRAPLDWSLFDLVVIRTPWDYFLHLEEFLSWVEDVEKISKGVIGFRCANCANSMGNKEPAMRWFNGLNRMAHCGGEARSFYWRDWSLEGQPPRQSCETSS